MRASVIFAAASLVAPTPDPRLNQDLSAQLTAIVHDVLQPYATGAPSGTSDAAKKAADILRNEHLLGSARPTVPANSLIQQYAKPLALGTRAANFAGDIAEIHNDFVRGEDLVATDISLRNIYFERAGNGWVAGILDVDFVVDWKEVMGTQVTANKKTVNWVRRIIANPAELVSLGKGGDETVGTLVHGITSVLTDGRKIASAQDFMEKMLEFFYGGNGRSGYVEFDETTKQFKARLLNPDLIEKYFKSFRKDLSPPPAAAPPVKKSGASTAPVRMRWGWPDANLPRCDGLPTFALAA